MKLDDLWYKYQGKQITGYGHYKISFVHRKKTISCTTTNTLAIDRINSQDVFTPNQERYGYTERQALQALYDECKRKNGIEN